MIVLLDYDIIVILISTNNYVIGQCVVDAWSTFGRFCVDLSSVVDCCFLLALGRYWIMCGYTGGQFVL